MGTVPRYVRVSPAFHAFVASQLLLVGRRQVGDLAIVDGEAVLPPSPHQTWEDVYWQHLSEPQRLTPSAQRELGAPRRDDVSRTLLAMTLQRDIQLSLRRSSRPLPNVNGGGCNDTERGGLAMAGQMSGDWQFPTVEPVVFLPASWYFAIEPRHWSVARWSMFQRGLVHVMDAASVVAIVALAPRRGDCVLDVCCAPGMKLSLMADAVTWTAEAPPPAASSGRSAEEETRRCSGKEAAIKGGGGVAVGVDVSLSRLYVARSQLRKARSNACCLICADGQTFNSPTANHDDEPPPDDSSSSSPTLAAQGPVSSISDTRGFQSPAAALNVSDRNLHRLAKRQRTGERMVDGSSACPVPVPHPCPMAPQRPVLVYVSDDLKQRACGVLASDSGTVQHQIGGETVAALASLLLKANNWPSQEVLAADRPPPFRVAPTSSTTGGRVRFDRVLVDAECTHDGSIAHGTLADGGGDPEALSAQRSDSATTAASNAHRAPAWLPSLDAGVGSAAASVALRMELKCLQLRLLRNGFASVRDGGYLVYSTCATSANENEEIVDAFLDAEPGATLVSWDHRERGEAAAPELAPFLMLTDEEEAALRSRRELPLSGHSADSSSSTRLATIRQLTARFSPASARTSCQYIAKFIRINKSSS